jgi:hypothetical protein
MIALPATSALLGITYCLLTVTIQAAVIGTEVEIRATIIPRTTTVILDTAPCQEDKAGEAAPACEAIVIPDGLCKACPVRPTRKDGFFEDCRRVYDLTGATCRTRLEEYVAQNPCDTRRAELVARWDAASIERLDYFVYALCELGCDAIPESSKAEQYEARLNATLSGSTNKSEALWNVRRGNAPAHFWYDLCLVFPNFRYFAPPKPSWRGLKVRAPVCPELKQWIDSPDADNWVAKYDVNISPYAQLVIAEALRALQLSDEQTWKGCIPMETAQGRI